ncbi:uncharacterized protein LOC126188398 [Schistocerca cancellata]|uniref:uncharacterized protein LOC126188398 n=1 Tax=Schistocerca cancellata TaxID=274614 RepID=UPI0021190CDE|nr:uncharacterized protein LOC126188398 [Schistocerca cancellata]
MSHVGPWTTRFKWCGKPEVSRWVACSTKTTTSRSTAQTLRLVSYLKLKKMWSKKLMFLAMATLLAGGTSSAAPLAKQEDTKQGFQYMPVNPWSTLYPGMNYGSGPALPPPGYPNYQGFGAGSYMRPGGVGFPLPYQYFQYSAPGMYSMENKRPKEQ